MVKAIKKKFPSIDSKKLQEVSERNIPKEYKGNPCPLDKIRKIEKSVQIVVSISNAEEDPNCGEGKLFSEFKKEYKMESYDITQTYKEFLTFLRSFNNLDSFDSYRKFFYEKILDKAKKQNVYDSFIESLITEEKKDTDGWIDLHLYLCYCRFNETTDATEGIAGSFDSRFYLKSIDTKRFDKAYHYLNLAISKNNLYAKMELISQQPSVLDQYKMMLKVSEEDNCLYTKKVICGITSIDILDENVYQAMANLWRRVIYHYDAEAAYELLSRTPEGVKINGKQFRSIEYDKNIVLELSMIFDTYCNCGQFHNICEDPQIINLYMKYDTINDFEDEEDADDDDDYVDEDYKGRAIAYRTLSINFMQTIRKLKEESKLQKEKIKQLIVFNKTSYDQNGTFRFVVNDLLGNKNWNPKI